MTQGHEPHVIVYSVFCFTLFSVSVLHSLYVCLEGHSAPHPTPAQIFHPSRTQDILQKTICRHSGLLTPLLVGVRCQGGLPVLPYNGMQGNFDNRPRCWSLGDRIVVLAPLVPYTGLQHCTGSAPIGPRSLLPGACGEEVVMEMKGFGCIRQML